MSKPAKEIDPRMRRFTVQMIAAGAGAVAFGVLFPGLLDHFVDNPEDPAIDGIEFAGNLREDPVSYLKSLVPPEYLTSIDNIVANRGKHQLSPLPWYLQPEIVDHIISTPVEATIPQRESKFGDHEKSYEYELERILTLCLGERQYNLVREIGNDVNEGGGGLFKGKVRSLNMLTHYYTPFEFAYRETAVHEIAHAIDPRLILYMIFSLYNLPDLIKITEGHSLALTQIDKIENRYINDPSSYNIPYLHRIIGEGLIKSVLLAGYPEETTTPSGHDLVVSMLDEILKENPSKNNQIIYTKKLCLALGQKCFPMLTTGDIPMKDGVFKTDWYEWIIEEVSEEIFGNMMADAICDPESIHYNRDVIDGISTMLATINSAFTHISDLRTEILKPSPKTEALYALDTVDKEIIQEAIESLPEIAAPALQDEIQKLSLGQEYDNYYQRGILPSVFTNLDQDKVNLLAHYGELISRCYSAYPTIINGVWNDDLTFDPWFLHVWETENIAFAANPNFVKDIVLDPKMINSYLDETDIKSIQNRIQILESFSNNPNFGFSE